MAAATAYTAADVAKWDVESVCGWLSLLKLTSLIDAFREHDITGEALLALDDEALADMGIDEDARDVILTSVSVISAAAGEEATAGGDAEDDDDEWNESDSDDGETTHTTAVSTPAPTPVAPTATPVAAKTTAAPEKKKAPSGSAIATNKKNDPLRLAAQSRAVADLHNSTVLSGFLWKVGGSGLKPKHWKRRFFVLTDDNCLYYFKSPKDLSALGLIILPSYTITIASKTEAIAGKQYAFKAFNREHGDARQYVFAAESSEDMKTWMNVMGLASIAFGSGQASMTKAAKGPQSLADVGDLKPLQDRAAERAGGVTSAEQVSATFQGAKLPSYVKQTGTLKKKAGGPTLCVVKLLDGTNVQLYAEPTTTGQQFLDQVCAILKVFEKYYFGLSFLDHKNEEDWLQMDKKVLKHDFQKKIDHLEFEFRVMLYPMDITQVLQYATLYQAFLATKQDVVQGRLVMSGKDALLLAAMAFQAQRGDCNPAVHTPALLATEPFLPNKTTADFKIPPQIKAAAIGLYLAEEVIRVWKTLAGVLKHLAVLKYLQICQKHRSFAMQFFSVKNKKGTPLTMGISPHGLNLYRFNQTATQPIVRFSWAECAELSYQEKRFTVVCHDSGTRPFSIYTQRSKTCLQILYLCVGLHHLFVQTVRHWAEATEEEKKQRQQAIQAALAEREILKKDTVEAREKAARLRGTQPAPSATAGTDPAVAAKKLAAAKRAANRISGKPDEDGAGAAAAGSSVARTASATGGAASVSIRSVTLRVKPETSTEDLPPPPPAADDAAADDAGEALPPPEDLPPPPPAVDNHMLDLMMADSDFMALQDELLAQMEADLMDGYDAGDVDLMLGDNGGPDAAAGGETVEEARRWRCASTVLRDRVDFVQTLDVV